MSRELYLWVTELDNCGTEHGICTIEELADMLAGYMHGRENDSGNPLPPEIAEKLSTGHPDNMIAAFVEWGELSEDASHELWRKWALKDQDDCFWWKPAELPKPWAGAPEMLTGLKACEDCFLKSPIAMSPMLALVRAAIAKGDPLQ